MPPAGRMCAKMYYTGIDIGSTATKVVVLDGTRLVKTFVLPTGWNSRDTADAVADRLSGAGMPVTGGMKVVATGYGRVSVNYAAKTVTEITCHGRGGYALLGRDCTVVDIGGQDTKVIVLENGMPFSFLMNDKCSAGTGKFLEIMANRLGVTLPELFGLAGAGGVHRLGRRFRLGRGGRLYLGGLFFGRLGGLGGLIRLRANLARGGLRGGNTAGDQLHVYGIRGERGHRTYRKRRAAGGYRSGRGGFGHRQGGGTLRQTRTAGRCTADRRPLRKRLSHQPAFQKTEPPGLFLPDVPLCRRAGRGADRTRSGKASCCAGRASGVPGGEWGRQVKKELRNSAYRSFSLPCHSADPCCRL